MWCAVIAALCGAHLHTVQAPPVKHSSVTRHSSSSVLAQAYSPQCIRAWVVSGAGELLAEDSVTLHIADPDAPSAPTDITAETVGDSLISWRWSGDCERTSEFLVYFDPSAGPPETLHASLPGTQSTWQSAGLSANTQYCIGVSAIGSEGQHTGMACLSTYTRPKTPVYGIGRSRAVHCSQGPGGEASSHWPGAQFVFSACNGFGDGSNRAHHYVYLWNQEPHSSHIGTNTWDGGDLVLSAESDGSYYLHLWAQNREGLPSTSCLTLGPYVVRQTCAHAKTLPETYTVTLWNKVVSGVFSDGFYVQEPDGAGGIRVEAASSVAPGSIVAVQGRPCVDSGEAVLAEATVISAVSGNAPRPLMMSIEALGGGSAGLQPATVDRAGPPVVVSDGLSPIGLLVKTAGTVTYVDQDAQRFAYVDDGSNLEDGSGHRGLRISLESAPPPAVGSVIEVTGCSAAAEVSGNCVRYLRPRFPSDIRFVNAPGLLNSGFEDGQLPPWMLLEGVGGVVAPGVPLGSIDPHSGSTFLAIMPKSTPFSGTICQVASVPSGRYHLSVWSRVFHGGFGAECAESRVGLDPTGGTNPCAASVVWSSWDSQAQSCYSEWRELLTPAAEVTSGTCTVFLQYIQRAANYQVNCFDDALLVKE